MERKFLVHPSAMVTMVETISTHLKESNFNDENIKKADIEIQKVAEFFDCNYNQAILLSSMVYLYLKDTSLTPEELSAYFKCSPTVILSLWNDFEDLSRKKLMSIETNRSGRKYFQLKSKVIDSIVKSDKSILNKKDLIENLYDLLDWYEKLLEERDANEIATNEFYESLKTCMEENAHLESIIKARELKLNTDEIFILLSYVKETIETGFKREYCFDIDRIIGKVLPNFMAKMKLRRKFVAGESVLIKEGYMKCKDQEYRGSSYDFCLTDKGKLAFIGKEVEEEIKKKEKFVPSFGTLIEPEKCAEKKLYYNSKEEAHVSELGSIISEERYKTMVEQMKGSHLRSGLTILMYGHPGTGKTETVYQLARASGRSVILIDISRIRSAWVGESEKNLKEIFNNYREAMKHFEKAPILLFNESDSLISKRIDVDRSVDQMHNNMQNILLQELEDFEGIFFATTNLTQNLDDAFERRFLFKIKFEKPTIEAKKAIWRSKLNFITEDEAGYLADNYDLSGGQIENVSRKAELKKILHAVTPTIAEIENYCEDEAKLKGHSIAPVGFKINNN